MDSGFLLLIDDLHPGDFNMALDYIIAEMVGHGELLPSVRIYGWKEATLSIGRLQKLTQLDTDFISKHRIPVVRRPTGGRAVLHHDEITYAFALPKSIDWVKKGTINTYKVIADVLLATLARLGVVGAVVENAKRGENLQACYGALSTYEISVGGRKLVGSAQLRGGSYVLQHGSIPNTLDLDTYARCFKNANLEMEILKRRVVTLSELLGDRPTLESFADALKKSLEDVLGVEVKSISGIPPDLRRRADALRSDFRVSLNGRDPFGGRSA